MIREGRGEKGNELSRVGDHEIRGVQNIRKEINNSVWGEGVGKQKGEVRKRGGGDGREM